MARNDGRIEAGQKLAGAISAKAWNRAQDAADRVLGAGTGMTGGGPTGAEAASNIVLVKNTSGLAVPWLGVLAISGTEISPANGSLTGNGEADSRAKQFAAQMVLTGGTPAGGSQPVAVAMEPIPAGGIGRMAMGGRFACKVKVVSTTHGYARGRNGDVTQLISAECGPIRLLWTEGQGNDKYAAAMV
jgi:hypothetical protein